MNLSSLLGLTEGWETLNAVRQGLSRGRRSVLLEGLPVAAKAWLLARLYEETGRPFLIVTYAEDQAARLATDLETFLPTGSSPVLQLPSSLPLLLDDEESVRDVGRAGRRLSTLIALANGRPFSAIVAIAPALLQKTPPPEILRNRFLTFTVGQSISPEATAVRLNAFGYSREDQVSLPGTFARRGDLIDIFPADADRPLRIDLFGDDIESIRPFDVESQRSEGKMDSVTIAAAHEVVFTRDSIARAASTLRERAEKRIAALEAAGEESSRLDRLRESAESDVARIGQAAYFGGIERYLPLLHPNAVSALDYVPAELLTVIDEPAQLKSHAERDIDSILKNLAGRAERGEILPVDTPLCVDFEEGVRQASHNRPTLYFELLARSLPFVHAENSVTAQAGNAETFAGRAAPFLDALTTYVRNRVRVVIVSAQAPRIRGMLGSRELGEVPFDSLLPEGGRRADEGGIALVNGVLRSGFKITDARLVVLTDNEVFGTVADRLRPRKREFRDGMRITSLLDLKEGDFVVHINHGIGLYRGLTRMKVAGVEKEYLEIQYEGTDKLFVNVDQVDRVQKYIGSEGAAPPLNKLGGNEWARTTAKAQRQVREIAKDLIDLYAARFSTPGHAYAEDTPWQREMEDAFPYTETPDQMSAIVDVKKDLEQPRPMDRLICGDVGFGKTEVAMRAAFKVASEGRQVAVLCPTTVLCAQHFQTFRERMAAFPVRIDMLSRFRSNREQAKTIEDIRNGAVDIVIGTHRLLSKDVEFKDIGLVVVDEEQRFGVTHKEKLKQLRKTVDVLAMSATPIPRTLQMSLSGIRDMSLINDPPEGRTPVKTLIKEYDDALVREAILRELDRGGQVYYIHNRIESIYHVAHHLEKIVPTARFRVGHGQMNEEQLEDTMMAFYQKEFDVLICTTIVESGLDIPNVNTIIIDNADKFGLSQLYQLRGRVGRSRTQAYAYLLYQRNKVLSTIAEQRLGALREFSDLGSGYKIALRDLELRGAGNLLGAEQSGTVAQVGFDLYMQLLEQAVREMKGEEPSKQD
ncbi:MAG: transcription-repair coupling factor, partial [Capsulimonadales bacterium]|nr:transcription-repair coupling factor [Capsulimonadales bacterium]